MPTCRTDAVMQNRESLNASYFDDVYAAAADPWRFETSAYEQAKYAATMAALPKRQFERAFEIGCSIGVLTALLAPRCTELWAIDVSDSALHTARQRLAALPQVHLQNMTVPSEYPDGSFDLVVLSEVGYYWSAADLRWASQRIVASLRDGATLVMVHWTPVVDDYPLTGDAVHQHFLNLHTDQPASHRTGQRTLHRLVAQRESTYRLDVFECAHARVE